MSHVNEIDASCSFLDCQKPIDIPSWLLKLSMITSAGTTDKASKEPFGKNLYNQEYWASM